MYAVNAWWRPTNRTTDSARGFAAAQTVTVEFEGSPCGTMDAATDHRPVNASNELTRTADFRNFRVPR
jgi:hypothetical protein